MQYWRHISAQHAVDLCSKLIGHNSFSVLVLHFHLLRVACWALSHWAVLWFALRLVHQSKSFKASLTVRPSAEAKEKKKKKAPHFWRHFCTLIWHVGWKHYTRTEAFISKNEQTKKQEHHCWANIQPNTEGSSGLSPGWFDSGQQAFI